MILMGNSLVARQTGNCLMIFLYDGLDMGPWIQGTCPYVLYL
jgi:hypothetical protein